MTTFRRISRLVAELMASAARRREILVLVAVVFLALVSCSGLFAPDWFEPHDANDPVARLIALSHELAHGNLYPRWLSLGYLGKGVPFFEFYAPGFYLVAGWLRQAGLPIFMSLKGAVLLFVVLGGWGMWRWCAPHVGSWGALLASALYMFAPYHFVDLYVRGALAELAALGVFPWLFRGVDLIVEGAPGAVAFAVTAIAAAGVVLVHNLSVLLIAPFIVVYACVRAFVDGRGLRTLASVALAGGVLGALLSAFYWLPAIAERHALWPLEELTSEYFDYHNHFVYPVQWLSLAWGFGHSVPGPADGMSFQMGPLLLGGAVAAVALCGLLDRSARRFVLLCAALGSMALLLTSGTGAWWYRLLPPYRLVQFPWRFLGPATLLLAACGGAVAPLVARLERRIAPALVVISAIAGLVALSTEQRETRGHVTLTDPSDERVMQSVASESPFGGLAFLHEYLPRWASVEDAMAFRGGPFALGDARSLRVLRVLRAETSRLVFDAEIAGPQPTAVTVPWYWFPGWRLEIDGRRRNIGPDPAGVLTFMLPAGSHRVDVRFGTTAARVVSWVLAAIGVSALVAIAVQRRASRRLTTADSPAASG